MSKDAYSIIIPCLNEEKFIGPLLESLRSQTDKQFEVIIIDGKSEDKTVDVINQYKESFPEFRLIIAEKRGVSYQRNLGASLSKYDHFLFLDADSRLNPRFLATFKKDIARKKADVACAYVWPDNENVLDWMFWLNANLFMEASRYVKPMGIGMNLYFRREVFEALGGFDEKLRVAEDVVLIQKAVKHGAKYVLLHRPIYYTDVRRLRLEGRVGFVRKLVKLAWQAHRKGSFENVDEPYQMGDWDKFLADKKSRRQN